MYTTESKMTFKELFRIFGEDYSTLPIGSYIDVSDRKIQVLGNNNQWNNILKIVRKENSVCYSIITNSQVLEVNSQHALFTKNVKTGLEDYRTVNELIHREDLYLIKENEEWVTFNVRKEDYTIPIVDFELDGDHSYAANEIVSHNTMSKDPKVTPGGNAVKFYASLRIRLLGKAAIEVVEDVTGDKIPIGYEVTARTDKNKMGPPKRKANFQIIFTEGIIEWQEWLQYLSRLGVISQGGGWYSIVDSVPVYGGRKIRANEFPELLEDAEFYDYCKNILVQAFIRKNDKAKLDAASEEISSEILAANEGEDLSFRFDEDEEDDN